VSPPAADARAPNTKTVVPFGITSAPNIHSCAALRDLGDHPVGTQIGRISLVKR
jgi:hypothetical protein